MIILRYTGNIPVRADFPRATTPRQLWELSSSCQVAKTLNSPFSSFFLIFLSKLIGMIILKAETIGIKSPCDAGPCDAA
jgi:hypothetical protein